MTVTNSGFQSAARKKKAPPKKAAGAKRMGGKPGASAKPNPLQSLVAAERKDVPASQPAPRRMAPMGAAAMAKKTPTRRKKSRMAR